MLNKLKLLSITVILSILAYIHFYNNEEAKSWSGTAWIINQTGYMATADHVVDGATNLRVVYKGQLYPAYVVARDSSNDVAIIKTFIFDTHIIPISLKTTNYQNIAVLGFPAPDVYGTDLKMATGTATFGGFMGDTVYVEANTCPGNSGGPIIDNYGNSVGILTKGYIAYTYNTTRCTTLGGGPTASYLADLAHKYGVDITKNNFTSFKSFLYWYTYYRDSVVMVYGNNL